MSESIRLALLLIVNSLIVLHIAAMTVTLINKDKKTFNKMVWFLFILLTVKDVFL